MREQILALLLQSPDRYISGEDIAQRLGITRAAVWKHMDALKKLGCELESKPNCGYRLVHVPDSLAPEILSTYDFSGTLKRCHFHYTQQTDSTNDLAKRLAAKGAPDVTVVVTEAQTHARGRMARPWTGEPGTSLMFSLLLRPRMRPTDAPKISLIAALAVARAIETQTGLTPKLKWPNDVLVDGRKICGILTEMSAECDGIEYIVCGIGINVNQKQFPLELRNIATSAYLECKRETSRGQMLLVFLTQFFALYDAYLATEDFAPVISEYAKQSALIGKTVSIEAFGKKSEGKCIGFDRDGCLVIEQEGKRKRVVAGDVSVRGEGIYV